MKTNYKTKSSLRGSLLISSTMKSTGTSVSQCIDRSAKPFSLSWPVVERRYVLRRLSVLKDLSPVATETGRTASIFRRVRIFGKRFFEHSPNVADAVVGKSLTGTLFHLSTQRRSSDATTEAL